MNKLIEKITALFSIKSLVTLICTIVFAILSLRCVINGEQFLTIFVTIIAFYFGTQAMKEK